MALARRREWGAVTVAYAEPAEDLVAPPAVENDPAQALMAARRDGLLEYHGYVEGGRYEVVVGGRRMILKSRDVVATVARLRALERLGKMEVPAQLVELRGDDTHVVDVDGQRRELSAGRVVPWCEGYLAARAAVGQEHVGPDHIAQIAQTLSAPTRDDQCRIVILGLMHDRGVSAPQLAQMIAGVTGEDPPAKKTVLDALSFGRDSYLSSKMAESMIRAFGLRWQVSAAGAGCVRHDGGPAVEVPQLPGLAALRRIVEAAEKGWLRYVGKQELNKARWDKRWHVTVGLTGYELGVDEVQGWLDGLAAFHQTHG